MYNQTAVRFIHPETYKPTAVVFNLGQCCGLRCLRERNGNAAVIGAGGENCFGVYKMQRGFDGYVTQGVKLAAMYPMLAIWRRSDSVG